MKSYTSLLTIFTGGLLLVSACSGESATADEQPQAAGDDWVESEINELDEKLTGAEDRAERLALDIELLSEGRSFPDVRTDLFAFEEIEYLTGLSVINGYSDGTFRPYNQITRGQTATMLVRQLDLTAPDDYELQATDVRSSHQNFEALRIVEYNEIMMGNDGIMSQATHSPVRKWHVSSCALTQMRSQRQILVIHLQT
ncbi:hypothetical protein JCM19037_794 [Geomicrobium sp. JCM 19037]|uniref:S-layer homology domain-containing protein n=1 Tax=Geomicrobium sp. JCM 19037 TaxID=1460634 RepID=UPI00045F22C7|nr:S-layer homology domain-containing protein [Geomicrobium sp. JCM 19037]GAK02552.1 hypothetical protein JCM19037_794 [Geomicrobium sp. JCM 19037]